ncbi:4'-phosphopantetheinyl transferase family protein [Kosakonia cowanii]|uniref:4'-phosphopantetheinyl transferase family protein n=1 Tax=Kosakonia cowanii TaxID=208223 RepID=UPI004063683C
MLTPYTHHALPPFITHLEMGTMAAIPELAYCQLSFDRYAWQDELFARYAIPFPPRLHAAGVKRRAEYLAARYGAKLLLAHHGCDASVGMAADRAPLWPAGWCGSLSHTHDRAIAIIAPGDGGLTPGVDIEMLAPETMRETADMFTSAQEQALLAACPLPYESALLIAFSAKESLFKALYPEVRRFFDFDAARVCQIDTTAQRITLELTQTLTARRAQGSQLTGYYFLAEDHLITLIA